MTVVQTSRKMIECQESESILEAHKKEACDKNSYKNDPESKKAFKKARYQDNPTPIKNKLGKQDLNFKCIYEFINIADQPTFRKYF